MAGGGARISRSRGGFFFFFFRRRAGPDWAWPWFSGAVVVTRNGVRCAIGAHGADEREAGQRVAGADVMAACSAGVGRSPYGAVFGVQVVNVRSGMI